MVVNNEKGQSILEFFFSLPIMIGLVGLMVRMNSAIQMSIVNQQYSRAQALYLTFNHPFYPEIGQQIAMERKQYNQLVVGVSEEIAPESGDFLPSAPTRLITRSPRTARGASDEPNSEPKLRANVRIRNTVTLCTYTWNLNQPNGLKRRLAVSPKKPFLSAGTYLLGEGSTFNNICSSELGYQ